MRGTAATCLMILATGCAHLAGAPATDESNRLWSDAHEALALEFFERATPIFERLATDFPASQAGRESLFFLGAIRLDPRNPDWDPVPAEAHLTAYLAADTIDGAPPASRHPEALTLLELARQLNMPPGERVPGLQPETRVVTERVVVPARESRANAEAAERLRRQLAESEATVQQLRDELERIRKTLTGTSSPPPPQ